MSILRCRKRIVLNLKEMPTEYCRASDGFDAPHPWGGGSSYTPSLAVLHASEIAAVYQYKLVSWTFQYVI